MGPLVENRITVGFAGIGQVELDCIAETYTGVPTG